MSVTIGAAVSTAGDPFAAATEAAAQAGRALGGDADLALVFASGAHLTAPEATLEGVHDAIAPATLIGCGAGGVLSGLADVAPGVPVLGGLASARTTDGAGALFIDEEVCEHGAVGVALEGVELLPCVSQGAAPLGRELTITAAQGKVILELAGRPAIETIEQVIAELTLADRALVAAGLLLGIVIDSGQPEYEQGDFLVRGVLGADRQQMFGACDHDAAAVEAELGGAPAAGFFAAGEIGPVGGRSFLHAFTATVAVFPG